MSKAKDSKSFKKVRRAVAQALQTFMDRDAELIGFKCSEVSVTHKVAEYLQQHYAERYAVDCEYDRQGANGDAKKLEMLNARLQQQGCKKMGTGRIRPDIVVHARGEKNNLLIIEAKKWAGVRKTADKAKALCRDRAKLQLLTGFGRFEYSFGLLLTINPSQQSLSEQIWYCGGRPIPDVDPCEYLKPGEAGGRDKTDA